MGAHRVTFQVIHIKCIEVYKSRYSQKNDMNYMKNFYESYA
jgi:hypothetical protein